MKFLVVDDSPTMRRIVCKALQDSGFTEVEEVDNGQVACDQLDAAPVDFVITDWNMPEMGGLELTRWIREHASLAATPVLMITTRGMRDDVIAAMQAGVDGYIVKPFTAEILRKKIEHITNADAPVE